MQEIKVVELFAGVGGFRIGLENASDKYKIVWSNQWEPMTSKQDASEIYVNRFGNKFHSNEDISKVHVDNIPSHNMLVGGFPCQDYSVATTLKLSKGLVGKKGVLWWQIHRIIKDSEKKPEFLLLENVNRLLVSPASQRGRDFAIILASLSDLGYAVEWRIINAADYGMPQRRRRIFIMAYHESSPLYEKVTSTSKKDWIYDRGTLVDAFSINKKKTTKENTFKIEGNLMEISEKFNDGGKTSPFENAGLMIERKVFTSKVESLYQGENTLLKDILVEEKEVPNEFFINDNLEKWKYHKGSKKIQKYNKKEDFYYYYAEGSMNFPDPLDKPSRTIITGEGGKGPSRFKHVVKTESGRYRRLTPVELERLNMFPDNHTEGCTDTRRAFLMGNALVTGVIQKIGESLINQLDNN
jgi:DNA (cytosine-5)-methyltransferase 1